LTVISGTTRKKFVNPNQPIKTAIPRITAPDSQSSKGLETPSSPGRINPPSPRLLPRGPHPGFENLKSKPGVYRCRLRPELAKRDPRHADYRGVLPLTGSNALILLWVHEDGLEKITPKPAGAKLKD
jgi:hypothetical protein